MLELLRQGLYCEAGDFFIDPSGAVENAVLTHAHSDHARRGATKYYSARSGVELVKARLGQKISISGHEYGEVFSIGPVKVSFHPAGHILGSAQVRLEHKGEVWVVSGDYKREPDPTCEPFETVKCDVFITEATFGTPAYKWDKTADLGKEIFAWWKENREQGKNSVVCAYSLGKTQRVLGVLSGLAERPIYLDPSATALTDCYRKEGVKLAGTICLSQATEPLRGELVVAPSSFLRSERAWVLGEDFLTAFASGWMAQGGGYGQASGYDHGFTMSDHADWDDLVRTVKESGAKTVYVQHRGVGALVRHLRGLGIEAYSDASLAAKPKPRQLGLF
jgi:putative mRNA 3-end processing factor